MSNKITAEYDNFANTYRLKSDSKKIIVKGLTLLDATLDLHANVIPGKTTLVLPSNDENILKYVAAVLNSPIAIFYIKAKFGLASYLGGITFTKEMINSLPVPSNLEAITFIANSVDSILERKAKDHAANISDLESSINTYLYQIYELSKNEIELIEGQASRC